MVALLLVLIDFGFNALLPKTTFIAQHQWHENLVKAESTVFTDSPVDSVIVGSSIALRLNFHGKKNWSDLTFHGLSPLDGLKIIDHIQCRPRLLLIEANALFSSPNERFYKTLFSSPLQPFKKNITALRNGREPIAIAGAGLKKLVIDRLDRSPNTERIPTALFNDCFMRREAELSVKLGTGRINEVVKWLTNHLVPLQKSGTRIIFFEVAESSRFYFSPMKLQLRSVIEQTCAEQGWQFFTLKNWDNYKTTDAVHLTEKELTTYLDVFEKYLYGAGALRIQNP